MIVIPEVINTILMGLIFMVILITIVRPLMLNLVSEYSGPSVQDAIIEEIELEVARHSEQNSQRSAALIEFHRQLLIAPPRPERKSASTISIDVDDDDEDELQAQVQDSNESAQGDAAAATESTQVSDAQATASDENLADADAQAESESGEIEIREGESLAEIKERMKREQQNAKKPTIPPELLNNAKSYEDKVGVVRMVVQQDQNRVAAVIRGMIKEK